MRNAILFCSLLLIQACATNNPNPDLLGLHGEESFPENKRLETKRVPIYLYPHLNAMGDVVSGTWLKIEDPR